MTMEFPGVRTGWMASLLLCVVAGYGVAGQAERASAVSPGTASSTRHGHARHGKERLKVDKYLVYIGTYTGGKSKGIYRYEMNSATGALTPVGVTTGVNNPSFLTIHPNHRFLYAVNEVGAFEGESGGGISAFAIQPDGELKPLNHRSTRGADPCFVAVDKTGKAALVANYSGGSVAAFPIEEDGRLGAISGFVQHEGSSVNRSRQEAPHAHSIYPDPANRFALVADLGLDKVLVYHLDAEKGTLTPNTPPFATTAPGAGPRHLAFHPNGRYVYVINEVNSTVTAYHYDAHQGTLKSFETLSTLPAGYTEEGNTTAEVQVHPSGKFLYGSNRGHNSIAIFGIDAETGQLHLLGHQSTQGKQPRNFVIDPTGNFLLAANQGTDNIVVFRIDLHTGLLTPTGTNIEVPMPVCIAFLKEK